METLSSGRRSTQNLQRRGSLPPRLQRPATLSRRLSRHSSLRPTAEEISSRLNKSNPYVGSFRHAPPSSKSVKNQQSSNLLRSFLASSSSTLQRTALKSSPYVGWFRHSPPSRLYGLDRNQLDRIEQEVAVLLRNFAKDTNYCKLFRSSGNHFISGHLKGGAPEFRPFRATVGEHRLNNSILYQSVHESLRDTSSDSTSGTINVLTRLATWFLFPLAHDADSCGYRHHQFCESDDDKADSVRKLLPHLFPSTRSLSDDEEGEEDQESSCGTESFESDSNDRQSTEPADLSVSSLADAYYAHHATKALDDTTHTNVDDDSHRLDYVITQMDIARMARNASRHLDVASILSLPTITYRSTTPPILSQQGSSDETEKEEQDAGWSWMIVPPNPSGVIQESAELREQQEREEESKVCVICLEHFVDGDRLRLLPCDHSFHAGCIDRWLSGSHSFDDCYTSGCPTCKKRPEVAPPVDGSVPSWAFARIGDKLARDSISTTCALDS